MPLLARLDFSGCFVFIPKVHLALSKTWVHEVLLFESLKPLVVCIYCSIYPGNIKPKCVTDATQFRCRSRHQHVRLVYRFVDLGQSRRHQQED